MKTDRELLELAAQTAGLTYEWDGNGRYLLVEVPWRNYVNLEQWNPLKDDGDALRLAVKTKVLFDIPLHVGKLLIEEGEQPSIEHAVRRAITRAAAQMQLNKENGNA